MSLRWIEKLPEPGTNQVGEALARLQAIPTWTAAKRQLFAEAEALAKRQGYVFFSGDCRDYGLERKGQSCLVDVPAEQRGALAVFAGKRIHLVCGGGWDSFRGRWYWAKAAAPPQAAVE